MKGATLLFAAAVAVAAALGGAAPGEAAEGVHWVEAPVVDRLQQHQEAGSAGEVAPGRAVFARGHAVRAPVAAHTVAGAAERFAEVTEERRRRRRKGIFKKAWKGLKNFGKKLFKTGKRLVSDQSLTNAQKAALMKGHEQVGREITGEDIEDCVACQFVWRAVELDVGNTQVQDDIYDSFSQQCIQAEKTKIFYPACEAMFEQVNDMIGDYVSGMNALELCSKAGLGCEGKFMPARQAVSEQSDSI